MTSEYILIVDHESPLTEQQKEVLRTQLKFLQINLRTALLSDTIKTSVEEPK
jgi:hypothetical protein